MTKPNDEQQLLAWYYTQKENKGSYRIYNPNDVNAFVCEVYSIVEAETIVNAVNARHPSPRAGLNKKAYGYCEVLDLKEGEIRTAVKWSNEKVDGYNQAVDDYAAQPKDDGLVEALEQCLGELKSFKKFLINQDIIVKAERALSTHAGKRLQPKAGLSRGWEKEFDAEFGINNFEPHPRVYDEIKAFIRSKITQPKNEALSTHTEKRRQE